MARQNDVVQTIVLVPSSHLPIVEVSGNKCDIDSTNNIDKGALFISSSDGDNVGEDDDSFLDGLNIFGLISDKISS